MWVLSRTITNEGTEVVSDPESFTMWVLSKTTTIEETKVNWVFSNILDVKVPK